MVLWGLADDLDDTIDTDDRVLKCDDCPFLNYIIFLVLNLPP